MAILVVGGAGYVGSHTARILRQYGYETLVLDNLSTGHRILCNGHQLIVGDIADRVTLMPILKRVDAILHFAANAYVGESVENPRKYFANNVVAGLNLLNAAVEAGVRHFIFSSTCAVYGIPTEVPIHENTHRAPVNPYGATKLFFENALESYAKVYDFRFVSLRYFNAVGADESGEIGELHDPETHLIPLALAAAQGTGPQVTIFGSDYPTPDGTCIRDYVHVNDLAEAHVLALRHLLSGGASLALNLGTGQGSSVKQVLALVHEVTGKKVPCRELAPRPGDPPSLTADSSLAHRLLGWKPRRSLIESISTAWNWVHHTPNHPYADRQGICSFRTIRK